MDKLAIQKTAGCFCDLRFGHRCCDFDLLFPEEQSKTDVCTITLVVLNESAMFTEVAGTILGIPPDSPEEKFIRLFKESGYTTALSQIDKLVRPCPRAFDWTVFSFVENKAGTISVVSLFQSSKRPNFEVRLLDLLNWQRHGSDVCFLFRNLDPKSLELRD